MSRLLWCKCFDQQSTAEMAKWDFCGWVIKDRVAFTLSTGTHFLRTLSCHVNRRLFTPKQLHGEIT